MTRRKKKDQEPEPCTICQRTNCISLAHRAQREWTPEAWEGARRMTEARLAAGYQLKAWAVGSVDDPTSDLPDDPSDTGLEKTEWAAVRVPLQLNEIDHLAMGRVVDDESTRVAPSEP